MSPDAVSPARVAKALLTAPFGAVAKARDARAVHAQGFLATGSWTVDRTAAAAAGVPVLSAGARYDVTARPSRGIGLPNELPDFLAIAVRIEDARGQGRPQDLLFNTSVDLPLLHHVFLPAAGWFAQTYSTCLPYRSRAGTLLVGLVPAPSAPTVGPSLDAMRARVSAGTEFGIAVATALGRWQTVGVLRLDALVESAAGDIDFEPVINCGAGLQPAPSWLQSLRSHAYRSSRRGRHAPEVPRLTPG